MTNKLMGPKLNQGESHYLNSISEDSLICQIGKEGKPSHTHLSRVMIELFTLYELLVCLVNIIENLLHS